MAINVDRIINPGTDYEFSISESIADLITHGLFTESELSAYMTCGYIDNRVQGIITPNLNLSQMGDYIDSCMFVPSAVTGFSADYSWNKQFPSNFQYYKRNLLVYSEAGINNGQYLTNQDYTKWYIVLDIDIKKFYLKDNFRTSTTVAGFTYTDSNGESIEVYGSYNNTEYQCLWQDDNTATTLFVIGLSIINGKMYFYMDNPHNQAYPKPLNSCAIWYDGGIKGGTGEEFITDVTGSNALSFMPVLDGLPDYTNGQNNQTPSQEYNSGYTNSNGELFGLNKGGHGVAYYDATSIVVRDNQIGARITKGMRLAEIFAWAGFKFKFKNTWYKPIISGGIVTGYTDDMSQESEWDDMTNVTGNSVPSTPPAPPEEDDESDDQASGGIYAGAQGMCNLYYMTAGEIKNLQDWFRGTVFAPGIQIPANFDPSDQLIGLMAFPVELGGSVDSTTITFRTADNQSVDTGVSCQKAYGDDLKFDLGTIDIPARMQQRGVPFLDYSCQIEVYIPFCNVVQLDVQQVIGTTLKCEMWISPATGDVSAMLSSGTHPVAYTSGNCAQQLPISVNSYGAIAGAKMAADHKMTQAVFQAAQNVIKDITNAGAIGSAISNHTAVNGQGLVEFSRIPQVQSNTGLAVGAGIKAAGTVVNTALQLTAQNLDNRYALSVAKNTAPTHVSGSFGSCTSWHFPNYCYVKITRPHFQKPDNYGHTEAVPVVATKQLSSLSGLTTCVNPDVSGIGTATMQELETIKGYLMSGVIL